MNLKKNNKFGICIRKSNNKISSAYPLGSLTLDSQINETWRKKHPNLSKFTIVSSPSREDVSHSLTTEEMHQDQPLVSNQTTTSSAKIRLETEQTTNTEGTL